MDLPESGQKYTQVRADATARLMGHLRRTYPLKTAEAVAAATGWPVGTVRKWLDLTTSPSGPALLALVAAYGADFLGAAFECPPEWLDAGRRADRLARLRAEIAALSQDI